MKPGRFDTNTSALKHRIHAHEIYGSSDINQWIFNYLKLAKGLSILELGCGTGKQTLPLAQIVGDGKHILAVDISQEALDTLMQSAKELGIENRISVLRISLDNIGEHLRHQYFDRVLACYSLYYAQYPQTVFEVVHHILNPDGILFFCGPAKNNNLELKKFLDNLQEEQPETESKGSVFMEKTGQHLANKFFSKVEIFTFENPLYFDSADALYSYWSSYNLYDTKLDAAFKTAAHKHFHNNSFFKTTKCVTGIRAIK